MDQSLADQVRALEARVSRLAAENVVLRERAALAPHVVILHPHEHDLTTQERMLFRMIQAAAPGSISAARLEARLPGERATTPSAYIGTLVAKTRRKLGHDAIITTPAGYQLGTLPGG